MFSWLIRNISKINRKRPIIKRENLVFPKTAIVTIASHGMIKIEKKSHYNVSDFPSFTVPDGMQIIKYSEVPPGTCNFMTDDKLDEYVNLILEKKLDKLTFENAYQVMKEKIVPEFMELKKEIVHEQIESRTKSTTQSKYINSHDNGYLSNMYYEGETMLNKSYTRENDEAHVAYDWQIVLLNMVGQPDLINLVLIDKGIGTSHHDSTPVIYIGDIVNFLKKQGVEKIIFFDYSCSNFINVKFDPELTEDPINNPFDLEIRHQSLFIKKVLKDLRLVGGRKNTIKKSSNKRKTTKRLCKKT
jgi:hypothetical protein